MPRVAALPGRLLIVAVVVLFQLLPRPESAGAQGQPAVVEGTSQLFIRRGPGREFPPFATLTGGSQVQVQEQRGTWARISTASGQVGYVHTKFLRLLTATPAAIQAAESTAAPTEFPAATQTHGGRVTATRRVAEATTPEDSPTATEAADLPSPTVTRTARDAAPAGKRNVQDELDRLSSAVEALNTRLDQRFPLPEEVTTAAADEGGTVSGGAIVLFLLGLVLGWLMGATYQRNKDRGRRSRIRL
jgi:uncharacterized protein YgiM (DUF1202 family)